MKRERWAYAAATVGLLLVEVAIAAFVHDRFVRPHGGDVLAVMLVYAAFRAIGLRTVPALVAALGLAVAIELGQLWGLLDALGLSGNRLARVALGSGFDPFDFAAYAAGALCVAAFEWLRKRRFRT